MTLHIEKHEIDNQEKFTLTTENGEVLAIFISEEALKKYQEQTSLTWQFAYQAGFSGI